MLPYKSVLLCTCRVVTTCVRMKRHAPCGRWWFHFTFEPYSCPVGDRALSPAAPMRSSKVAPQAEAAATEAAPESKLPRAPLLRRLGEIDATIAHIKLPDGLDGYKTLPLHTAASRGDFREVAALLPTHGLSLTLRDEAGWMPVHHAACAGRRAIYRVPLHQVRATTTSASLSPSLAQLHLSAK